VFFCSRGKEDNICAHVLIARRTASHFWIPPWVPLSIVPFCRRLFWKEEQSGCVVNIYKLIYFTLKYVWRGGWLGYCTEVVSISGRLPPWVPPSIVPCCLHLFWKEEQSGCVVNNIYRLICFTSQFFWRGRWLHGGGHQWSASATGSTNREC